MIGTDILKAAELLKQNELVAIPTETVYGLAGNAFNPIAVAKIFEVKNRPTFNPLIVHIKNIEFIHTIAQKFDERLLHLLRRFSPGPLTILVEKKTIIPDLVTAGSSKVAIRIPNHPMTLELLNLLDFPLAAPSANPFQYISPTTAQQVEEQLGNKIPYILDGGKCKVGIESTIVGIEENNVVVYRLGGVSIEDIEKEIGKVVVKKKLLKETEHHQVITSGQLEKHYAPKKPVIIGDLEDLLNKYKSVSKAIILFGDKHYNSDNKNTLVFNLSPKGDFVEAAAHLFETLYLADKSNVDVILCELLPDVGLGRSINDRLKRASKRE
ncbi:MAG: tRNA threonylcarbamoyladenosine biosynthesis protein [Bacteroidia bacterium]|nr:MAG: tRNA threonylcarbamoyladenosine biosynthesis protein [Bacteroidia bacterium]